MYDLKVMKKFYHEYSKCSKILITFLSLSSNKMWVTRAGINRMLVRIANRVDPDHTALQEQSDLGLHCLFRPFWQATSF